MQGTGKLSEKCTMKETCGSTNTNWMNGAHPEEAEGIVEREVHIYNKNMSQFGQGPSFFTVSRVREIGCFWGNPVKSTVDP